MSAAADAMRRGWCPGALRPMETGDGYLVRLRVTGGILSAHLAREIAQCAREFGNGLIDLSNRAHVQIRGVASDRLDALTARLGALGLLDADPAGEAVRNVMASPLAGLDPAAALDIRPVTAALEDRLTRDTALHSLPGKFGFLIDDGGVIASLAGVAADIRFDAFEGKDGPAFAVGAGGTALSARAVAVCRPTELPDVAAALAKAFLTLRGLDENAPRHMQVLVERVGARKLAAAAGLAFAAPSRLAGTGQRLALLGWHGYLPEGVLGIGVPFGRLAAADLVLLTDLAGRAGSSELRLTPWRSFLLPGIGEESARASVQALSPRFILDKSDARVAVAACPGGPACSKGSTPTQRDALAFADLARALAPQGVGVHVSGCAKGCARAASAPVTLIGRQGRYDVVLHGSTRDAPSQTGLDKLQVAALLRRLAAGGAP
jgi:precorrin-3B synthase